MDYVEVPLYGKYSHLKSKLDKDWYQMICVDGGIHLMYTGEKHGYVRTLNNPRCEYVHGVVMNTRGFPKFTNLVVDHINGGKLDNRRCNLRLVSNQENSSYSNKEMRSDNKTGIRGLSKLGNTYRVQWHIFHKSIYDKSFKDYEEAKAIAEFHNLIRDL